MAPNDREERRRMRQRGAGVGAVSAASFGFTFGGPPLPAQPSARRTPQPLPARRSSRQTPQQLSSQRSSRKTPVSTAPRTSTRKTATPREEPSNESSQQSSTGKLRRVKTPQQTSIIPQPREESREDELERMLEGHPLSEQRSTPAPRRSMGTLRQSGRMTRSTVEETPDELEQGQEDVQPNEPQGSTMAVTPRETTQQDVATAPSSSSTAKRSVRTRKSVAGDLEAGSELGQAAAGAQVIPKKRPRGRPRKSVPSVETEGPSNLSSVASRDDRQTRTAEQPSAMAIPSEAVDLDNEARAESRGVLASPSAQNVEHLQESEDELSPEKESQKSKRNSGNPRDRRQSTIEEEVEEESDVDKTASTEQSPVRSSREVEAPRPRQRDRPPKSAVSKPSNSAPANARASKRQKRAEPADTPAVPIKVYRLSKAPPTVPDDPGTALKPRLPAVNAVDVLAQLTAETTSRLSSALVIQASREADRPRRAELKRRAKAIDAFSTHLADRLFELTTAVDANSNLEARVRSLNKEKAGLRDEWLNVRGEREKLAWRMDEVRRKHVEAETERREHDGVNDALFDIEVAVQRGKERVAKENREDEGPERSLEWELQEVTDAVGRDVRGGGLLDRLQKFNSVMERTAQVIEGKA